MAGACKLEKLKLAEARTPQAQRTLALPMVDKTVRFRECPAMRDASSMPEQSLREAPPRWNAVGFMVDFNSREKRLGLLSETLGWFASVAFFRRAEMETHYLTEPTELDKRFHKSILAALIAEGERLLTQMHLAGSLGENIDGVKAEDVEAGVEELHNTQLQWYGDLTPQRRDQILQELFHVPAS